MRKVLIATAMGSMLGTAMLAYAAGPAGAIDNQLVGNAYVRFNFGGDRALPKNFHYGMRLDYDQRFLSTPMPFMPSLLQMDFNEVGFNVARLNGLPVVRREYKLNQAEVIGVGGAAGAATATTVIDWGLLAVGVAGVGVATAVAVHNTDNGTTTTTGTTAGGATGGSTGSSTGGSTTGGSTTGGSTTGGSTTGGSTTGGSTTGGSTTGGSTTGGSTTGGSTTGGSTTGGSTTGGSTTGGSTTGSTTGGSTTGGSTTGGSTTGGSTTGGSTTGIPLLGMAEMDRLGNEERQTSEYMEWLNGGTGQMGDLSSSR